MEPSYCQSCGMPLYTLENHGTDKNGSRVEDYCQYCYKEGQFTSDCTMEEMIQLCSKYVKEWNNYSDRTYTKEEAVAQMHRQFPLLKRWASKEETQNMYYQAIGRVLDYIREHLNERPDLEALAGVAHISSFHFHRIFKAITGENVGKYRQRLCMEYVASQLRSTSNDLTLEQLALETGYNGVQALSKTFRKHYGVAPTTFRKAQDRIRKERIRFVPEIRIVESMNLIYTQTASKENTPQTYKKIWEKLIQFAIDNDLWSKKTEIIGLGFDDPDSGNPVQSKFYACISTQKFAEPNDEFGTRILEGGLFAIFTLKGSYKDLSDLYKAAYFDWLPGSDYVLRKGLAFEKYLNDPFSVKEQDVLTEIYLPVSPSAQ